MNTVDKYYDELSLADELRKKGEPHEALKAALTNAQRVPQLVDHTVREYGRFDLESIPPIQMGCMLAAVVEDENALRQIRSVIESRSVLAPWETVVEQGYEDLASVRVITQFIAQHPGCIQSTLPKTLLLDGQRVSYLLQQLALARRVSRVRKDRSYALFVAR